MGEGEVMEVFALGSAEGTEAEALTCNKRVSEAGCGTDGEGDNSLCRRLGLGFSQFPIFGLARVTGAPLSLKFGYLHALDRDETVLINDRMRDGRTIRAGR